MPLSTHSRRPTVLRLLLIVAPAAAALYALLVFLAWRFQERVAYQPPPTPTGTASGVHRVSYAADDDAPLFAYVIGDPAVAARTVLAFHGNADLAIWELPWAEELARRGGVAVVLAEYRGYSGLGGVPTYDGLRRDAAAARDEAMRLGAQPAKLVYYGHSLGSAIASELAAASPPARLVLESPFTSARDMAARMGLPGLAWIYPAIARVRYATVDRVRALAVPVWVAQGDRDLIVPLRMGRSVYAAAADRGELLVVHGGGHNDLASVAGERYWSWLTRATAP